MKKLAACIAGIGLALAGACRAPTQVTLSIEYDGVCTALRGVGIVVSNDRNAAEAKVQGGFYNARTSACESPGHVGTLVATPDGSGRGAVIVVAGVDRDPTECTAANGYFGCIVARRSFSFIDHVQLTVPIDLEVDCKNLPCDAVSTCRRGNCVPSDVDCTDDGSCSVPGELPDGGPIEAVEGGDAPTDAPVTVGEGGPVTDAAIDAGACGTAEPLACNGTTCTSTQVCCNVSIGGGTQCVPSAPSTATCQPIGNAPIVRCRGKAQCGGYDCCGQSAVTSGGDEGSSHCATAGSPCAADAGSAAFRFCEKDCDCPSEQKCDTTTTFALGTHRCVLR